MGRVSDGINYVLRDLPEINGVYMTSAVPVSNTVTVLLAGLPGWFSALPPSMAAILEGGERFRLCP